MFSNNPTHLMVTYVPVKLSDMGYSSTNDISPLDITGTPKWQPIITEKERIIQSFSLRPIIHKTNYLTWPNGILPNSNERINQNFWLTLVEMG